jgi:hypothetical protein
MTMRVQKLWIAAVALLIALPAVAQDRRGDEQTERISRKFRIGATGRLALSNISGDIAVTAGSGDEVTLEAVKRTRGDRSELSSVVIEIDDRPGRVDIRTRHTARRDRSSVDYTLTVPCEAVDLASIPARACDEPAGPLRAQASAGRWRSPDRPTWSSPSRSPATSADWIGAGRASPGRRSAERCARDLKTRALALGNQRQR